VVCNSGHSENCRLAFSIVDLKVSFPHMADYAHFDSNKDGPIRSDPKINLITQLQKDTVILPSS
jgi:hypothetical protein